MFGCAGVITFFSFGSHMVEPTWAKPIPINETCHLLAHEANSSFSSLVTSANKMADALNMSVLGAEALHAQPETYSTCTIQNSSEAHEQPFALQG